MRWPRRRKPRKSLAAQRIDRAIGQAVADAHGWGEHPAEYTTNIGPPIPPVVVRAPAGTSEQIRQVPLPSIRADLPPCAPFPDHQPHEYRGVCFQCSGNTKAALLHLLSDHDCLTPPIRRYAQENPMTAQHPAVGAQPGDIFRALSPDPDSPRQLWLRVQPRTATDPHLWASITIGGDISWWVQEIAEKTPMEPLLTAVMFDRDQFGTECHRAGYARGHAAGQIADLPLWLNNVVDAARTISDPDDTDHYRGLHTPGQPIVVLTEDYLEQIKTEAVAFAAATVDAEAVGSPAWLRDLADRLHLYLITRFEIPADTAGVSVGSPDSIRDHANEIERREHRAARNTRDRERVEQIVLRQWETAARTTVDAALARVSEVVGVDIDTPAPEYDVAGFWATLTDEEQAEALAPALELYRAGRDDTVAAWQPGNGGGSGNPGPRGGQPTGQGGAHHA